MNKLRDAEPSLLCNCYKAGPLYKIRGKGRHTVYFFGDEVLKNNVSGYGWKSTWFFFTNQPEPPPPLECVFSSIDSKM